MDLTAKNILDSDSLLQPGYMPQESQHISAPPAKIPGLRVFSITYPNGDIILSEHAERIFIRAVIPYIYFQWLSLEVKELRYFHHCLPFVPVNAGPYLIDLFTPGYRKQIRIWF